MAGQVQISDEQRRSIADFFEANPRVSETLPRTLPCGFRMLELELKCSRCSKAIPPGNASAQIRRLDFGGKVTEDWEVKGVCIPCKTLTPFRFRFHSTGDYDTVIGHRWRVGRFDAGPKEGLWGRVKRWIGLG